MGSMHVLNFIIPTQNKNDQVYWQCNCCQQSKKRYGLRSKENFTVDEECRMSHSGIVSDALQLECR